MKEKFKMTEDGFVWLIITKAEAMYLIDSASAHDIDLLYDDGTERIAETPAEIEHHNGEIGLELGFLHDILLKLHQQ